MKEDQFLQRQGRNWEDHRCQEEVSRFRKGGKSTGDGQPPAGPQVLPDMPLSQADAHCEVFSGFQGPSSVLRLPGGGGWPMPLASLTKGCSEFSGQWQEHTWMRHSGSRREGGQPWARQPEV